jgi:hypothetical protein
MILLSVRAALRAKEIAAVTWGMVTDAQGKVGTALHLTSGASKGRNGCRTIPLNKELRKALIALKSTRNAPEAGERIIHSERDVGMSANAVTVWFHRLYASRGFAGASSDSGRRTFVPDAPRKLWRPAAPCATCKSLRVTLRCRRRSGTFRAIAQPSGRSRTCCDRTPCSGSRGRCGVERGEHDMSTYEAPLCLRARTRGLHDLRRPQAATSHR